MISIHKAPRVPLMAHSVDAAIWRALPDGYECDRPAGLAAIRESILDRSHGNAWLGGYGFYWTHDEAGNSASLSVFVR
jgi:hypothetical protein